MKECLIRREFGGLAARRLGAAVLEPSGLLMRRDYGLKYHAVRRRKVEDFSIDLLVRKLYNGSCDADCLKFWTAVDFGRSASISRLHDPDSRNWVPAKQCCCRCGSCGRCAHQGYEDGKNFGDGTLFEGLKQQLYTVQQISEPPMLSQSLIAGYAARSPKKSTYIIENLFSRVASPS